MRIELGGRVEQRGQYIAAHLLGEDDANTQPQKECSTLIRDIIGPGFGPTIIALNAAVRPAMLYLAFGAPAAHAEDQPAVLPAIDIQTSAEDGSADTAYRSKKATVGLLGEKSLQDTPFSVNVFSRELMEKRENSGSGLTIGQIAKTQPRAPKRNHSLRL